MDQSRSDPGCICIGGASPICPAQHRVVTPPPAPEWVRRAGRRELPAYVMGGVPLEPSPMGRIGHVLVRLGILADDEMSARLSAMDAELDRRDARSRPFRQAHPMAERELPID